MDNHGYMADLLADLDEAGSEIDLLERLSQIAKEAGHQPIVEMLDKCAHKCEERIAELHRELVAAGWSDD